MNGLIPYITFPSRPYGHGMRSVPLVMSGEKTTQWRIIRPQPPETCVFQSCHGGMCKFEIGDDGSGWFARSPLQPGDVAYVKETWSMDDEGNFLYYDDHNGHPEKGWKRVLTMPPQAARLYVRITDVQAVRLHDLTSKDVAREGLGQHVDMAEFPHIWTEYISGEDISDGGHWKDNPWIWIISFKKCGKPKGIEAQYWPMESVEKSMKHIYRNKYEIRIRATGELVVAGTAEECAEKMDRTTHAIYDMVRKSERNEKYLYKVTRTHGTKRSGPRRKKEE